MSQLLHLKFSQAVANIYNIIADEENNNFKSTLTVVFDVVNWDKFLANVERTENIQLTPEQYEDLDQQANNLLEDLRWLANAVKGNRSHWVSNISRDVYRLNRKLDKLAA